MIDATQQDEAHLISPRVPTNPSLVWDHVVMLVTMLVMVVYNEDDLVVVASICDIDHVAVSDRVQ